MTPQIYYNDIEHLPCEVLRKNIKLGNLPEGYVDERDIRQVSARDVMGYRHVHLFAGIGGFPLGFKWAGVSKHIRILTGGFPCQDISNAGKRAGITGSRSGLWAEQYRLIQESLDCGMGFDYIVVENVAALVHRGLSTVLGDLAQAGYDAEWRVLRASDFGAPHQRERIFIVAYPCSERRRVWAESQREQTGAQTVSGSQAMVDSDIYRQRIRQNQQERGTQCQGTTNTCNDGTQELMAYTSIQGLEECGCSRIATSTTQARARMESEPQRCSGVGLADANEQRLEIRNRSQSTQGSFSSSQFNSQRQSERGICRVFNGLPYRMDRSLWPAGPGQEQYDWEPARTVTKRQPQRVARLKALGNGIVPQIAQYIGYLIINHYEQTQYRERVIASLGYKNTDHVWTEAHGSEAL